MKIKPYQKGIIFGILTALVTLSTIGGVYFKITHTNDNNYLLPPFEWNFSSIDTLSLQMSERSDDLLVFSAETLGISESRNWTLIPYFNYSVYSIHSWYNTEEKQQMLLIDDYLYSAIDYEVYYTIQAELLVPFGKALANDLQTAENYTDIAENYWEEIEAAQELGVFSIWITYVYQDGSYIKIETIDNTVFIRYATSKKYFGSHNSWGANLDNEEYEDGRDKYNESYKATIPQIFPNLILAVNTFLDYFY